jgi:hypothetical protein
VRTRVLVVLFSCFWLGCLAEVKASSRTHLSPEEGTLVFPGPPQDAAQWVADALARQGVTAVGYYGPEDARIYIFKAKGEKREMSGSYMWADRLISPWDGTVTLGSIFYVYATPVDQSWTYLSLLGKPTLSGLEVCSREDREWKIPCYPVSVIRDWAWRDAMDGQAQAKIIRGVREELAHELGPEAEQLPAVDANVLPAKPPRPVIAQGSDGVVCETAQKTGSHFNGETCTTEEQREAQQRRVNEFFNHAYYSRPGDGAARTLTEGM